MVVFYYTWWKQVNKRGGSIDLIYSEDVYDEIVEEDTTDCIWIIPGTIKW